MRLLIIGNSGSGKSTLASRLADRDGVAHLDLDAIVWEPGQVAVQRPVESVHTDLDSFLATHAAWVIEGCYAELVERSLPHCTRLVFLNPGVEACLRNNERRPWEPHKYESAEEQDRMLPFLRTWVAEYATRNDGWSYQAHRRVFDGFAGDKIEIVDAAELASQ